METDAAERADRTLAGRHGAADVLNRPHGRARRCRRRGPRHLGSAVGTVDDWVAWLGDRGRTQWQRTRRRCRCLRHQSCQALLKVSRAHRKSKLMPTPPPPKAPALLPASTPASPCSATRRQGTFSVLTSASSRKDGRPIMTSVRPTSSLRRSSGSPVRSVFRLRRKSCAICDFLIIAKLEDHDVCVPILRMSGASGLASITASPLASVLLKAAEWRTVLMITTTSAAPCPPMADCRLAVASGCPGCQWHRDAA